VKKAYLHKMHCLTYLTFLGIGSSSEQGRSWHRRFSLRSLQFLLSLVTRSEIPQPQVVEQADHSVVWIIHRSFGRNDTATGSGFRAAKYETDSCQTSCSLQLDFRDKQK